LLSPPAVTETLQLGTTCSSEAHSTPGSFLPLAGLSAASVLLNSLPQSSRLIRTSVE